MILHGNEIILPLKPANLNTEFQFDWIPRTVYTGNICIYPKNAIYSDTIGAFQNIYYNASHNTYSDLPDLWSGTHDTNRVFEAKNYYYPTDHSSPVRSEIRRTMTAVRDSNDGNYSCVNPNMWKMRWEDAAYQADDPDYPNWKPRPYRYQDVYWVCNTDPSKTITVTGVTAWAILLLSGATDSQITNSQQIGFTFLRGSWSSNFKSILYIVDPVPMNGSTSGGTVHCGYGGFKTMTEAYSSSKVLKDFTRNGTRNTIVALKGRMNWLDEPITTNIMSQPYLNFGNDNTPKTGKILMLGAEYHGTLNDV